jgi:5'-nucleotidase
MQKVLVFFLLLVLMLPLNGQSEKKITILHTNDLHSRLIGYAPESAYSPLTVNDDNTIGGFARIAAIIKAEKESNAGTTLVVDAGDFLMGTLFPSLELKTGFQLRLKSWLPLSALRLEKERFLHYSPVMRCLTKRM